MSECPCGHSWSGRDCVPPGGTHTDDGAFVPQEGTQGAEGHVWAIVHPDLPFRALSVFDNEPEALAALAEAKGAVESFATIPFAGPVIEAAYVPLYRELQVERWQVKR